MRYEIAEPKMVQIAGNGVLNQIEAVEHDGEVWLSIEKLKASLQRDGFQTGKIAPDAGWYAMEAEMEEDEFIMREITTERGTRIEKFVNEMGAGRLSMAFPNTVFAKNVRKYYKQLHRDDRERRKAQHQMAPVDPSTAIADALGKHLAPILTAFGSQIRHIESSIPLLRDENEFVTVRSRIREHSYDESQQVNPSGHNLEEWVGAYLKHNGYEPGDKKEMIRLGGTSRRIPANTWRRKDIDEAIKQSFAYSSGTKKIN